MKFGVRIHWGIYSIWHRGAESWPFLKMSFEDRARYNDLYKTWNPHLFDAAEWMRIFKDGGMKMFAFTTKHHEGFSMFDTKTRVSRRADWSAQGGPRIESCDLAYSIMETPFRRDIVGELSDAAHKSGIKIDFYFSHPDWYDADFRPYVEHPLQVPSSAKLMLPKDLQRTAKDYGGHPVILPDPTDAEVTRMMARHRAQLVELLSNYGTIDMMCLDMYLGPRVWPELRKTILKLREIQPNVMLRDRGIGNYGDYYTPERAIPQSLRVSSKPWFCINPLGQIFLRIRMLPTTRAPSGSSQSSRHNRQGRRSDDRGRPQSAGPVSSRGSQADRGGRQMARGQWRSDLCDPAAAGIKLV